MSYRLTPDHKLAIVQYSKTDHRFVSEEIKKIGYYLIKDLKLEITWFQKMANTI